MRVSILNFADGPRVVYDATSNGVEIPIGSKKDLDIAVVTANFIMKSMRHGDAGLVIVPPDTKLPEHIAEALACMRGLEHEAYDVMLARIQACIGREAIEPRPTRVQMRQALARVIIEFCEQNMAELVERAQVPPAEVRPDNPDGALTTALGEFKPPSDDRPVATPAGPGTIKDDEDEEENDPPKKKNKRVAHPAKSKKQLANEKKKAVPKTKKKARVRV